jgi:hypothetical protein
VLSSGCGVRSQRKLKTVSDPRDEHDEIAGLAVLEIAEIAAVCEQFSEGSVAFTLLKSACGTFGTCQLALNMSG